jgi:hypothetical protein
MEDDVQAAKDAGAKWVIVIMHKGPYTTSNHATDSDIMGPNGVRTLVAPIMSELGIDLVLQGHDHIYARSKPIKSDGAAASADKITEIVHGQTTEYTVNPDGAIYLIPSTAGPKVYYKNTKISDPSNSSYVSGYFDLFEVADEHHAAVYGPDPGDPSRPVRGQIQNFESITIDGSKLTVVSYEIDQSKYNAEPYVIEQFGISKPEPAGATIKSLSVVDGNQQPVTGSLEHGKQYYLTWKARKNSDGSLPGLAIVEALRGSQPVFLNAVNGISVSGDRDTEYSALFQPATTGTFTIKGFFWNGWSNNASWLSLADPAEITINVN